MRFWLAFLVVFVAICYCLAEPIPLSDAQPLDPVGEFNPEEFADSEAMKREADPAADRHHGGGGHHGGHHHGGGHYGGHHGGGHHGGGHHGGWGR